MRKACFFAGSLILQMLSDTVGIESNLALFETPRRQAGQYYQVELDQLDFVLYAAAYIRGW